MPIRHSIATVLQYHQIKNSQLYDSHTHSKLIATFFTRMEEMLTPQGLFKNLIELLISSDRMIGINTHIIEGFDK